MANLITMQTWMQVILANMLDLPQIATLLNKADLEECESWPWARLRARMTVNSVASTTYSSITAVQGSAVITNNSGNFPAVTAQQAFRVSSQFFAPIGVVANPNPSNTITLVTPFPSAGGSALTGTLMQLYYSVPGWQEVTGVTYLFPLDYMTQEELDQLDPWLSQISSPSLRWIPHGRDAADNVQVTLWPLETASNPYVFHGIKQHTDMVNSTDLPLIPSAVIVAKALAESCESLFTLRGDATWANMRDYYNARYLLEQTNARESDRTQYGTIRQIKDYRRQNLVSMDTIPYRDGGSWE